MKNLNSVRNTVLLSSLTAALWILTRMVTVDASHQDAASATYDISPASFVCTRIACRNEVDDAAVRHTVDATRGDVRSVAELVDDTVSDQMPLDTGARAAGSEGLSSEDFWMAEANRIVSELYRDGILSQSVSLASVAPDNSANSEDAQGMLWRLRRMQERFRALEETIARDGRDAAAVDRNLRELQTDYLEIQKMAAELRAGAAHTTGK